MNTHTPKKNTQSYTVEDLEATKLGVKNGQKNSSQLKTKTLPATFFKTG